MNETWGDRERFNRKAAEWDQNPIRLALASAVAASIKSAIRPDRTMKVMEFGCGTGLITTQIAPHTGLFYAVDTSPGMLEILDEKIAAARFEHVITRCLDLADPESRKQLPDDFDLVYSSMTLHHIRDTEPYLESLYGYIAPGGKLAVADLDAEDGSFHDDASEFVHRGFDRDRLTGMIEQAGFHTVSFETAHVIEKKNREGVPAQYSVFLAVATRKRN
jgi:ubiquinone/menaquinone biosynthesis C-methylase UbiE